MLITLLLFILFILKSIRIFVRKLFRTNLNLTKMKTQQQNTIDSIVLMTATQLQTLFDAYQDLMCEMNDSPYDLEDDEIEYAKEILKKCNAIIKVQEILLSNKL